VAAHAVAAAPPYARGTILRSTEDDLAKLRRAWRELERRDRVGEPIYNFTGLERSLRVEPATLAQMDDELAPAATAERLRELALAHLGGDLGRHDVVVCNRTTAALVATVLTLARPGETVAGLAAGYTHPAVTRAVALAGARLVDAADVEELAPTLDREAGVSLVVVTRLSVTYELLPAEALARAVEVARAAGARVLVDDAGGARVGPAVFGQPRTLELGADAGVTGLDKYGTVGPRLGLLAGERELVAQIRARAFELGLEARPMLYPAVVASLEQYEPDRVRMLVVSTRELGAALRARLGSLVHETPVSVQLRGEDVLREALARAGASQTPLVPYEATAALAMLLLVDHGVLTVHFAAVPPGTSALLLKFVPPEVVDRFGGADRFAAAVDEALDRLAGVITDERAARGLLFGP
jgi:L-seryl-tRNA(Ser) seleniumtransferase